MNLRRAPALLLALALLPAAGCASSSASHGTSTSVAGLPASRTPGAGSPAPTSPSTTAAGSAPAPSSPASPAPVDCARLRCIALTYDDGPSRYTPALLDAFTRRHARATLFMLGNAAHARPQVVHQAYAQGFEIANHTWDHKAISSLGDAQVAQEVGRTNAELKALTGVQPTLMRPPYAARSTRTDAVCGRNGLAVVVWSTSPEDWLPGHQTAAEVTRLTLQRASRNAIILMHDIHPWTVQAAPGIIDALQRQGYTLVTVGQLLGRTTPGTLYPRA